MPATLFKLFAKLGPLLLVALLVSPMASAKQKNNTYTIPGFKILSNKELKNKSRQFRAEYVLKRARLMEQMEKTAQAFAKNYGAKNDRSASFLNIFGGAYSNAQGDDSLGKVLVQPGKACTIGGYDSTWSEVRIAGEKALVCKGVMPCKLPTGKAGHVCRPEMFLLDGSPEAKPICVSVARDLTANGCFAKTTERLSGLTQNEQYEVIERDLRTIASRNGSNEIPSETYRNARRIHDDIIRRCNTNITALESITGKLEPIFKCDNNKYANITRLRLEGQRCSCFPLYTFSKDLNESDDKSDIDQMPDWKKPLACIQNAARNQGEVISDKYLAMLAVSMQKHGKAIDGQRSGVNSGGRILANQGSYNIEPLKRFQTGINGKLLKGLEIQAKDARGNLRFDAKNRPIYEGSKAVFCKNKNGKDVEYYKEGTAMNAQQSFLRRMIENIDAKGWCSSWDSQGEDQIDAAGTEYLNEVVTGRRRGTKDEFQDLFGFNPNRGDFSNAMTLQVAENSLSRGSWGFTDLKPRRQAWQSVRTKKRKWWQRLFRLPKKVSGYAGACMDEAKAMVHRKNKDGQKNVTNLCKAMADSCGLPPGICGDKKKQDDYGQVRCEDVSSIEGSEYYPGGPSGNGEPVDFNFNSESDQDRRRGEGDNHSGGSGGNTGGGAPID